MHYGIFLVKYVKSLRAWALTGKSMLKHGKIIQKIFRTCMMSRRTIGDIGRMQDLSRLERSINRRGGW